ncbi:HTH_Tnp_Tc3_2 domain-containing protein [Trichonephila clavipes]|nr:HTH_Tnp_Tc3_2 domain-containing protein [Trichonephila clavipes]
MTVHGKGRLRRIVRSQRSQILAQITIQLNDGANHKVSKQNVQHSLHCMDREWSVEYWKLLVWRHESPFQIFNTDRRLKIWHQDHESMDPACHVGAIKGMMD